MADVDEWMLAEDGCLYINESINNIIYHPTLNTVLITTKDGYVQVLDVCSGIILQSRLVGNASSTQSEQDAWIESGSPRHINKDGSGVQCIYIPGHDKVLFTDGKAVGLRRDHNGVLLLDTALQTRICASSDDVKIEILYTEALQLVECMQQMLDNLGSEQERVLYELEFKIGLIKEQIKGNHKVAKWCSVCLELPYNVLKPAFYNLVQELKRLNRSVPSLSIASAVSERLNVLISSTNTPESTPPTSIVATDRSLMFSEAGRRETFGKWPHMNYKWALPDQMAQAGFYHQSNSTGDDRAMCFTCNICLVCWEPTDEPWSEHERHSPSCPFVKGEFTQNVPLSITYATSPAVLHSDLGEQFSCVSVSSFPDLIGTATESGNIVVWDTVRILKKKYQFLINPHDPIIVSTVLNRQKRLKTLFDSEARINVTEEDECFSSDAFVNDSCNTSCRDKDLLLSSLAVLGNGDSVLPECQIQETDTQTNYLPSVVVGLAISDSVFSHNWTCFGVKESPLVQVMNDVNQIGSNAQSLDIMKLEENSRNVKEEDIGACNSTWARRRSSSGLYLLHVVLGWHHASRPVPVTVNNNSNGLAATGSGSSTKVVPNSQIDASRLFYQPLLSEDVIEASYEQYLSSTLVYMKDLKLDLSCYADDLPNENNSSGSSMSNGFSGVTRDENAPPGKVLEKKDGASCGRIVRCVELPGNFNGEIHRVSHVVPTSDGFNVLVVVGKREDIVSGMKSNTKSVGALFLYHLEQSEDSLHLIDTPVLQRTLCDPEDMVVNVLVLPTESRDFRSESTNGLKSGDANDDLSSLSGLVTLITAGGAVQIIELSTLESVGEFKPQSGKKFVSATYCSSIERLCVATSDGELHFIQVSPIVRGATASSATDGRASTDYGSDYRLEFLLHKDKNDNKEDHRLFGMRPLTTESLQEFFSLTKFMNLSPRFSATLPACWTEIQQEQRQRRHPQHLQQQGKANLHTRSWKLQPDSSTWDEHLLEITLPKSCSFGHIDLKFSLVPTLNIPNIQLTLLKQNSKGINTNLSMNSPEVDSSVNFNLQPNASVNRVNSSEFLKNHNAEIMCGPLSLANYLDLSGHNGVVTFTSTKLIDVKARTFLIHIKSLGNDKVENNNAKTHSSKSTSALNSKPSLRWQNLMKIQDRYGPVPSLQSLLELYIPPTNAVDLLASSAPNRSTEALKGCDLFQEISITVRTFKKNPLKNGFQRVDMLTNEFFHEQLMNVICNSEPLSSEITHEHQQNLALDILNWIAAIQFNNQTEKADDLKVFLVIERNLKQLIWSCFLDATRSIAHKCSKLIIFCIEYSRSVNSEFEASLLQALLEWLPSIDQCRTAGALHWFFLLINHVKQFDTAALGRQCLQLLVKVVKQLNERNDPLHAVLRSRFGLHRTPFDMDLFDIEAPQPLKSTSTPVTYATVVGNGGADPNVNNNNSVIGGVHISTGAGATSNSSSTILNSSSAPHIPEEGPNNSPSFNLPNQHLKGLLEVEPLHFTCSAASDGTKVEKIFYGFSGGSQNPLSMSPNMTICVPTANGTQQLNNSNSSRLSTFLMDLKKTEDELIKVLSEKQDCNSTIWVAPNHSNNVPTPGPSKANQKTSTDGNPRTMATVPIFPWQHFLQPPSQQILVIERMHSGARRFVVIDFGKPIVLTDFMIPACQDLISLSVDIWCDREEIDGQRVVVSSDICYRPLVMNDILPPPVCRFLKITAIGRYGMGTTKCRIPMGVFYGYTTIPPWIEQIGDEKADSPVEMTSKLQVHLSVLSVLLEDIHCRYSLMCDKLQSLLAPFSVSDCSHFGIGQTFGRGEQSGSKTSDEETKIITTYRNCIQLQQQLNLVASTMDRLVRIIPGNKAVPKKTTTNDLSAVYTDKLRALGESLLVTLLSMTCKFNPIGKTVSQSSSPGPSCSTHSSALSSLSFLQSELNQPMCELLFRYLAVSGYSRFQTMANALLVRTCGLQPWWGSFVAKMLVELYHSNQTVIFPQDRVFLLLVSCHDKPILHNTLPSILHLLEKLLAPLAFSESFIQSSVDLTLVGWVLLFVSFYLDVTDGNRHKLMGEDGDEAKPSIPKDRAGFTSRWDFIQEEWAMLRNQSSSNKLSSGRLCRRKLHKRIMYHKQLLDDLEQAKKISTPGSFSHVHAAFKRQEQLEKKILSKRTAKHFKDIVQLRRAEQAHHSMLGEPSSASHDQLQAQRDNFRDGAFSNDTVFNFPRSQNLQVARGIVTLLLSMDYTCNVDTFLLACKVLAKIVIMARPAIGLGDIVTQSQLHTLMKRCIGSEGASSSNSWGDPWARHAITCLLQDILEGEKLHPVICNNRSQECPSTSETTPELFTNFAPSDELPSQTGRSSSFPSSSTDDAKTSSSNGSSKLYGLMKLLEVESDDTSSDDISADTTDATPITKLPYFSLKKDNKSWFMKNPYTPPKTTAVAEDVPSANWSSDLLCAPTVSVAVDARMEMGVESRAELRLKTMASSEAEVFVNAFFLPIFPTSEVNSEKEQASAIAPEPPQLPSFVPLNLPTNPLTSVDMLANCFNELFQQARIPNVNLEHLLQLWVSLNDSATDPSIKIVLPLSSSAISGILAALAWHPVLSIRTWYLAFKVLNMAYISREHTQSDFFMTSEPIEKDNHVYAIAEDSNLLPVLMKFLSGQGLENNSSISSTFYVGPTVAGAMHSFIWRLIVSSDSSNSSNSKPMRVKEQLLRIVYLLVADKGAIRCGLGPLDAQHQFIHLLHYFHFAEDDSNLQTSIIEAVASLVHSFLLTGGIVGGHGVVCHSSTESEVSDAACFSNILSVMPRNADSTTNGSSANLSNYGCTRSNLIHSLLSLCINLAQSPIGPIISQSQSSTSKEKSNSTEPTKIGRWNMMSSATRSFDWSNSAHTDEHKFSKNSNGGQQLCSHSHALSSSPKQKHIADEVLRHQPTMMWLLSSLASCSGSSMAMFLGPVVVGASLCGSEGNDRFFFGDPVSVGDTIFQLLCTLNSKAGCIKSVLRPVYTFLTSEGKTKLPPSMSEPLVWLVMRILDCETAIEEFLNMGGVQTICENLVTSHRQQINSHPSMLSAIMQKMNRLMSPNLTRGLTPDADNFNGLINFAPTGVITLKDPTIQPADILLQPTAPHRRARTPAWSYHFYPDESWVELTITLPCAVLLKEVRIQPHLTSLASCPSAVSLEISSDGITRHNPLCPPRPASGLTFILLQLVQPEIATSIVIRLYRPRDSANIGLSQILLLGTSTFGDIDAGSRSLDGNVNLTVPTEECVAKSSVGWLRLLHHCLVQLYSPEIIKATCTVAASVDGVLQMCCSLLLTPTPELYTPHVELVLLHLGRLNSSVGLQIINTLLHICSSPLSHGNRSTNRQNGKWAALDSVMDIVYLLCTSIDSGTSKRIEALLNWLHITASKIIENRRKGQSDGRIIGIEEPHGVPIQAFVHCIASVLWSLNETDFSAELYKMFDAEILKLLVSWSSHIPINSNSKIAINSILTSICYIRPDFFENLIENILFASESKLPSGASCSQTNDEAVIDDSANSNQFSFTPNKKVLNIDLECLDPNTLTILSAASQSFPVIKQLIESGIPAFLARSILEFCWSEGSNLNANSSYDYRNTESDKVYKIQTSNIGVISVDMVTTILNFFSELCLEGAMRDWLGEFEGSVFWLPLLHLLCRPICHGSLAMSMGSYINFSRLTSQQTSTLEVATIRFLTRCCWCHPNNQKLLAQVLCGVINKQPSFHRDGYGMMRSMSGFARRLFLQLLLENEKILVFVKSRFGLSNSSSNSSRQHAFHPRFGCGHRYKLVYASSQTTCSELLQSVTGDSNTFPLTTVPEYSDINSGEQNPINFDFVDYLSMAAGVLAKDKRSKDAKTTGGKTINPTSTSTSHNNKPTPASTSGFNSLALSSLEFIHDLLPDQPLPGKLTLAQLLSYLEEKNIPLNCPYLVLNAQLSRRVKGEISSCETKAFDELSCRSFSSTLNVFASIGGLALLAQYLPILYPDISRPAATAAPPSTTKASTAAGYEKNMNDLGPSIMDGDWVKVEAPDDIFEDLADLLPPKPPIARANQLPASVPPHSLAAFSLFLRLPNYAETLLKERQKAQFLLRLALGVTDDGEGADIFSSSVAATLPTLPFQVLQQLFDALLLTTDDGILIRKMAIDVGAIHLILGCLSVLSHQNIEIPLPKIQQEILAASRLGTPIQENQPKSDDKSHLYWAKGTGFGTGSTAQSWDVEQAILRQKSEEEHVTCLLRVLASYINPGGVVPIHLLNRTDEPVLLNDDDYDDYYDDEAKVDNETPQPLLPSMFSDLLSQSCVFATISSYLRNDSVLDMARHVPLYRALLQLIRAMAVSNQFVGLLIPPIERQNGENEISGLSICCLLTKMKACVDTYASRLKSNKGKSTTTIDSSIKTGAAKSSSKTKEEEGESEGLALLIPDIQETAEIVETATACLLADSADIIHEGSAIDKVDCPSIERRFQRTLEDRYIDVMRQMQFDTFEMIVEDDYGIRFTVPHHFESNLRAAGDLCHPSRSRRLAQEAVTLSTSLPLSYSSSVFVRCDQDRLDIMKVLITAPVDTPYANGCFEFDVYFPPDYPNSPMMINLETTGHHTVRFNPNLYNDGKVCLSILNTWHGRPEEKWNPQTSSFLQVLVSIQSLILVPEPYFNEPGYERSRGTPSGKQSSREYDSNIRQATVKWAMLEQLRSTCSCFKEAIHRHFWLKRVEVTRQCQEWINEMEEQASDRRTGRTIALNCQALKRHFAQLKEEFSKMKHPSGLEDLANLPDLSSPTSTVVKVEDSDASGTSSRTSSSTSSSSSSSTASCSSQNGTFLNEGTETSSIVNPITDIQELVNVNSSEEMPATASASNENSSSLTESQVEYSTICGSL